MFAQLFYIINNIFYDDAITTWTNMKTRKYFFALVAHWNKKTLHFQDVDQFELWVKISSFVNPI